MLRAGRCGRRVMSEVWSKSWLAALTFLDLRGADALVQARAALPIATCQVVIRRANRPTSKVLGLVGFDGPCRIDSGPLDDRSRTEPV